MPRYMVRSVKDVLGENGRQAEICQRSMDVDANNKLDAAELAKKNFCGTEGLFRLVASRRQNSDCGRRLFILNPTTAIRNSYPAESLEAGRVRQQRCLSASLGPIS